MLSFYPWASMGFMSLHVMISLIPSYSCPPAALQVVSRRKECCVVGKCCCQIKAREWPGKLMECAWNWMTAHEILENTDKILQVGASCIKLSHQLFFFTNLNWHLSFSFIFCHHSSRYADPALPGLLWCQPKGKDLLGETWIFCMCVRLETEWATWPLFVQWLCWAPPHFVHVTWVSIHWVLCGPYGVQKNNMQHIETQWNNTYLYNSLSCSSFLWSGEARVSDFILHTFVCLSS